jgi:PhzF family phenazine biosynthesis protein
VKGLSFIMVELPDLASLATIQLCAKPQAQLDDESFNGFLGLYFFVITDQQKSEWKVRTRMIEGSFEDPATGSAACALSAYLAQREGTSMQFELTQGVEMGRQSDIGVAVTLKDAATVGRIELSGIAVTQKDAAAVNKIVLSGSAVLIMEGSVKL